MKYMDYTIYKKLNSQKQDINWIIYLPIKPGKAGMTTNLSLIHNATSLLKKTLKHELTPKKEIDSTISSLRIKEKDIKISPKSKSLMFVISNNNQVDFYGLPIDIKSGMMTDSGSYILKPLDEYYNNSLSYYVLDINQKGSKLFSWNNKGLSKIDDIELEKSLDDALAVDERNPRNIQIHMTSASNSGQPEGFHGQGGYKDKRKEYIKKYLQHIDSKLSKYSKKTIKPIVIVGSKQITAAFIKISHNKRHIKGYVRSLPNQVDVSFLQSLPKIN